MSLIPKSAAGRAYNRRILVAMAVYVLLLAVSTRTMRTASPSHALAIVLAILPAIPIVAVIGIVGVYLREEKDEFKRTLLIEALLWSMGGTLAVTSVWGFLENFHQAPHMPAYYTFILFWAFAGVAGCVQHFLYRTPQEN